MSYNKQPETTIYWIINHLDIWIMFMNEKTNTTGSFSAFELLENMFMYSRASLFFFNKTVGVHFSNVWQVLEMSFGVWFLPLFSYTK